MSCLKVLMICHCLRNDEPCWLKLFVEGGWERDKATAMGKTRTQDPSAYPNVNQFIVNNNEHGVSTTEGTGVSTFEQRRASQIRINGQGGRGTFIQHMGLVSPGVDTPVIDLLHLKNPPGPKEANPSTGHLPRSHPASCTRAQPSPYAPARPPHLSTLTRALGHPRSRPSPPCSRPSPPCSRSPPSSRPASVFAHLAIHAHAPALHARTPALHARARPQARTQSPSLRARAQSFTRARRQAYAARCDSVLPPPLELLAWAAPAPAHQCPPRRSHPSLRTHPFTPKPVTSLEPRALPREMGTEFMREEGLRVASSSPTVGQHTYSRAAPHALAQDFGYLLINTPRAHCLLASDSELGASGHMVTDGNGNL
ncbi:hypothetical protein FIBSPDRAFT_999971 [Athelia psychrophila]|uniref:Uncharacterized protein n=1 Tax=Athelia psychrophila TaxID=1759441 RepID=A0A167X0F3_9AGAM|nr:hypothetical protein FIBSPDRAFT_999971 [Fibularhizoctonia sp. CBS 109695]